MPRRPLPSPAETADILSRRRTRPAHRAAPPVGKALTPLIKQLDAQFGQGPALLHARWREIVGEALARHTEPVKLIKARTGGGTLELKVAGPAAAIVQHQAHDIMARLNLILGSGAVTKLRIVQGVLSKRETPIQARRRKKAPLDAAAEAELARGLADAEDGPLKAALLKLGREVMRSER